MELQYRRPDGTFVALVNDLPYHVDESTPYWEKALATPGAQDLPMEPARVFPDANAKPDPEPTKAELLAQIKILTAKVEALA